MAKQVFPPWLVSSDQITLLQNAGHYHALQSGSPSMNGSPMKQKEIRHKQRKWSPEGCYKKQNVTDIFNLTNN